MNKMLIFGLITGLIVILSIAGIVLYSGIQNQSHQVKTPEYMKEFYTCMPVNGVIHLDKRCN